MVANGHVTILFIINPNQSFIYWQHSVKVSKQYVKSFLRYSVLNPYTLNIQESLKHAWHLCIGFLRYLAATVLKIFII